MKTQNSATDTLSENFNVALKMFMETTNAMVDIYSKQFQLGTSLMNKFMRMGIDPEKIQPSFNTDLFYSAFEIMKKNMQDMIEVSRKNIPVMKNFMEWPAKHENGHNISDTVLKAYNLQAQQMTEANKWFLKTFSDTFNITNGEQAKLFDVFQKNSERNFQIAEEGIKKALKSYTSISEKTTKDMHELVDTITEKMQLFSDNNMKDIWAALLQTPEKEMEHADGKRKEKHSKK